MRRGAALLATVALCAAGCTGPTRHVATPSSIHASGATPVGSPRSETLPTIQLEANVSRPPTRWDIVASIPFGPKANQLGLVTDIHHLAYPHFPRSFAIAPDGSFWILDEMKERIARYSSSGDYLGQIGGFPFARFRPFPRDIVFSGGNPFVLDEGWIYGGVGGVLIGVGPDGPVTSAKLMVGGDSVAGTFLTSIPGGIGGWIAGVASPQRLGTGPRGFARFDPVSGETNLLPGLPVRGAWVNMSSTESGDVSIDTATADLVSHQTLRIQVVAEIDGKERVLPGLVGPVSPPPTALTSSSTCS